MLTTSLNIRNCSEKRCAAETKSLVQLFNYCYSLGKMKEETAEISYLTCYELGHFSTP